MFYIRQETVRSGAVYGRISIRRRVMVVGNPLHLPYPLKNAGRQLQGQIRADASAAKLGVPAQGGFPDPALLIQNRKDHNRIYGYMIMCLYDSGQIFPHLQVWPGPRRPNSSTRRPPPRWTSRAKPYASRGGR